MDFLLEAIIPIILACIIVAPFYFMFGENSKPAVDTPKPVEYGKADMSDMKLLKGGQFYFCEGKMIGVSPRKGYSCFWIKGMRHRFLSLQNIGRFEGFANAEEDNEFDRYAIAIWREDFTHVGYLPARNRKLYNYIKTNGGYVHCIGYIATYVNGAFYGEVAVETDCSAVKNRNKEYHTEKYYEYKEGYLKEFLDSVQLYAHVPD